jgi:hypothetical protein
LGIGTSSLDPNATVHAQRSDNTYFWAKSTAADSTSGYALVNDARTWIIRNEGGDADKFQIRDATANAQRLTIDNAGNVGIGTSLPSQELHVVSSGTAATRIQGAGSANYLDVFHSASSFGLWGTGEQFLQLVTNNAERMRIDSAGRIGIGTSSPERKLHIFNGESGALASNVSSAMVIEDDSNQYISFLSPTFLEAGLLFGDSGDNDAGALTYNHLLDRMSVKAGGVSGVLNIESTGIDVTGTATMDGLTVDGDGLIQANMGAKLEIKSTDNFINNGEVVGSLDFISADYNYTAQPIKGQIRTESVSSTGESAVFISTTETTNLRDRIKIDKGGDISFYEDTGTTPKLFWDASAESLGIGTSSPAGVLDLGQVGSTGANTIFGVGAQSQNYFTTNTGGIHVFRRGTTEDMRIDSAGNVGIGTSSPDSYRLNLYGAGNGGRQLKVEGTSNNGLMRFSNSEVKDYSIGINGTSFIVYDDTADTYRMVVDTNGNVGIGTSAPASLMHLKVAGTGGSNVLSLENDSNKYDFRLSSANLIIRDGASDRVTLDSAGNLLVGKSAASSATVGFQAGQDGFTAITRASGQPLVLNRTTNDGIIAEFRKDGTNVGSWQSRSSLVSTIVLDPRAGGVGLGATTDTVLPANGSAELTNGELSLGSAGTRFKDFYLSGGVYLGGTGAANKLDDYEEGTWTPTITGVVSGSATLTVNQASYTKVGRAVHVSCYIINANVTGLVGTIIVGGLPFTANGFAMIKNGYSTLFSFDQQTIEVAGYTENGQAYIRLHRGSSTTPITGTDATAAGDGRIMMNFTYKTS